MKDKFGSGCKSTLPIVLVSREDQSRVLEHDCNNLEKKEVEQHMGEEEKYFEDKYPIDGSGIVH